MMIVGCDYHPSVQQIAYVDAESGELKEQRLAHREGAEEFYRALAATGERVRVGIKASGQARWFERLLAELQFELWVGDASAIRRKRGRKQKTDRRAQHILGLLQKDDFPPIWVPSCENRDLRQLIGDVACGTLLYTSDDFSSGKSVITTAGFFAGGARWCELVAFGSEGRRKPRQRLAFVLNLTNPHKLPQMMFFRSEV